MNLGLDRNSKYLRAILEDGGRALSQGACSRLRMLEIVALKIQCRPEISDPVK
jgi:hypothetical protein